MSLPLDDQIKTGFIAMLFSPEATKHNVEFAEKLGMDSIWVGDHIEFPVPILDPLLQIALAAGYSDKIEFGTSVYLLPLRHAVPTAKQVSTLDTLTQGRFIFGTGVGGEFANEWEACGVPHNERGGRMTESIDVLKKIWSGEKISNADGKYYPFESLKMSPKPATPGGPRIWTGGRSEPALARAGRQADGWISYVVTPDMYADALVQIEAAADEAKRDLDNYGTGHLLFMRIDNSYEKAWDAATEHLSMRYAMDFREAAQKYCAMGKPADVAERVAKYKEAGCRHFVLDLTGPYNEREDQIEWFAKEVKPLL